MRIWESFLKVKEWSSDYASVDLYLGHFKRKLRSEATKELCCDVLTRFCKFAGKNPDELMKLSPAEASRAVQGFVDSLADRGQSVKTVNVALTFLRTFFDVNGFRGDRKIEVERFFQPSRYRKRAEYIPTPEEIYRMAYAAGSARNKAMIMCLYTSGLRNSTLRAVRYKDVESELEKFDVIKVPVYPEMKEVDPRACKGNIPYYTFFSKEAVRSLKEYLSERKITFGSISGDEPLLASTSVNVPKEVRRKTPSKRKSLDLIVKRAAEKAGITSWKEVHAHCLRKAFESALRIAGMDPKDQEFLMGHILPGSQDAYYDRGKVDYLRGKYAQVTFFPERTGSDNDLRKRQILDTARLLGYSEDKIKKVEEALAKYEKPDEAMEEIRKLRLDSQRSDRRAKTDDMNYENVHNRRGYYRIVRGELNLVNFLNDGWDIVKELPEDKFILKRDYQED